MTAFDDEVYEQIRAGTQRSARVVAPLLIEELRYAGRPGDPLAGPFEVLDVGCGEGWWSAALAADPRVKEVISIDQASPSVTAPGVRVQALDLERGADTRLVSAPFDLVVCLETAEHLTPAGGDGLVSLLCRLAAPDGVIAWSAAVPGQGGHGHANEQWPAYWDARFRREGWMLIDPLRDVLWERPEVEPWYAQNLLIAAPKRRNGTHWAMHRSPRALVHPAIWEWRINDVRHWRAEALKWETAYEMVMG